MERDDGKKETKGRKRRIRERDDGKKEKKGRETQSRWEKRMRVV